MKLFINRDNSASDVCFVIYDELGRRKYLAEFKKSKHPVKKNNIKVDISDTDNNVAVKIRQLTSVGLNAYSIKTGALAIKLVMIKTPAGVIQYKFYGSNWHFCGDVLSKNFSIIDVDNTVISVQCKQAGRYVLEINDPANELACLGISICTGLINTVDKLVTQAV